jgi:hypothetical protein
VIVSARIVEHEIEKSRDLVTGRAQEHLVKTGIFHFNINNSFSCILLVLNECLSLCSFYAVSMYVMQLQEFLIFRFEKVFEASHQEGVTERCGF